MIPGLWRLRKDDIQYGLHSLILSRRWGGENGRREGERYRSVSSI